MNDGGSGSPSTPAIATDKLAALCSIDADVAPSSSQHSALASRLGSVGRAVQPPSQLPAESVAEGAPVDVEPIFSRAEWEVCSRGFSLLPTDRFAYTAKYIERTSSKAGFELVSVDETWLRMDADQKVQGCFYVMRRLEAAA
jgi:hypothetical protein